MADGRILRGEATRERVLAAARELFGSRGYEDTSIESVLAASGVARGALYHHFPSKADLFDAVAVEVFVEIADRTWEAARRHRTARERLRAGSHAWLGMARDPEVQRIALLDPQTVLGWRRWRGLDERYSLGALRAAFARLAEEGAVPAGQADVLANVWLAALNEAALLIADADDGGAAHAQAVAAIDTLLDRLTGTRGRTGARRPRTTATA